MSEKFEGAGETIRRRPSLLAGAAVFQVVAAILTQLRAPAWSSMVELALALALVFAFLIDAYRVRRRGTVRADAQGIRLDERLVARRERIVSAFPLSAGRPVVRVVLRRGLPFDVRVETEAAAQRLLAALGMGLGQSIVTFRALYGSRRRFIATAVASMALSSAASAAAGVLLHRPGPLVGMLVMMLTILLGVVGAAIPLVAHVDVGSDGILLRRFARRRFIGYGALEGASIARGAIVLALRSGERLRLTMGRSVEQLQSCDALVRRIEEAREAFAEGQAPESVQALVAPGGRTVARWAREVRALATAHEYREAALDAERLWRIVDDASAPAATRAGAALALSRAMTEETRGRLRVASEACADPRLRVALTRVADQTPEDALEEALAPLVEPRGRSE